MLTYQLSQMYGYKLGNKLTTKPKYIPPSNHFRLRSIRMLLPVVCINCAFICVHCLQFVPRRAALYLYHISIPFETVADLRG